MNSLVLGRLAYAPQKNRICMLRSCPLSHTCILMSTPICWLVLTVLATCITALTIKQRTSPETYDLAPRDVCDGFVGNPDLYGLGIRVGIYLQWVSSLLINVYVPAEMADALDTNSIFVFAVFIAIAVVTSSTEGLHPAEAFIMLQMCFGYLLSVLSVSGLRVTLLSDPQSLDTDIWRAELSKKKGFLTSVSGRYAEISELFKVPFKDPPESADISSWSIGMFRVLDSWTFHAIVSINSTRGSFDASFWALQPVLWMFDLYVFLWAALEEDSGVITDPKKIFRRERFQDYQRKRALAIGCLKPKLFSLGLESSFKNDQTSWFGVCWRSCLVAGIAVYNVWFWFGGIDILRGPTATCTAYIFLFSKVDILGGAGVFFKIFSIVYIAYAGVLFATCCLVMLAFLGTTLRSVMINLVVLPYARLVLFAASLGSKDAERKLEKFDEARGKFLDWLGIPSIRQLLSGYAYLSSNPKDAEPTDVIMDAANGHTW